MKLVFIDPKCPTPYDSEVLDSRGLGGTEATVIRIARALAQLHEVVVVQHNRKIVRQEGARLSFLPASAVDAIVAEADHIIFIQKAQDIDRIAKLSKGNGRLWVWLHNFLGGEVPFFWQDHVRHALGIICVSKTHAEHTRHYIGHHPLFWLTGSLIARGGVTYLHNPIDDLLGPTPGIVKDQHKLVFFSSPYKGIEHVLAAFKRVHTRNPEFRLVVADPGYFWKFDASSLDQPGITKVGTLPHHAVMKHVQEALCVFYPQHKRPETFGLVYAEANALGVPVLAHDFGVAREVLVPANPPIDAHDMDAVVETVLHWHQHGGPVVTAHPDFALNKVASLWTDFLKTPDAFMRRQRGLA